MKIVSNARRLSSLLLVNVLLITPAIAQQKQPTPTRQPSGSAVQAQQSGPKEDEVTFDTLLAARSYKLYVEVRMIGQLVRSNALMEMLEPARLLGGLPKEAKGALEFISANADALAASRVMFAATPARAGLPQNFIAVELASTEDAIKLEPKFRNFFSSLKTQTPATAQSGASKTEAKKTVPTTKQPTKLVTINTTATANPILVQRAGSLILMSDTSFTLKNLRPGGSQLLSADQNFQRARSRFASEPLFIYYDVKLAPSIKPVAQLAVEPPSQEYKQKARKDKSPVQTDRTVKPDEPTPPAPPTGVPQSPPSIIVEDGDPGIVPDADPILAEPATGTGPPAPKRNPNQFAMALPLFESLFGGPPSFPEAVGAAAALEGGEMVVRAMWINAPGTPNVIIPFMSAFISGPEIAPRASALSPADTATFISVSLDLPRIYDAMLKGLKDNQRPSREGSQQNEEISPVELQMAMFEQALGFKIKEDLLGALGNEVAVSLPSSLFKFSPNSGVQVASEAASSSAQPSQTGITVFVSLNDKERVREMLPRVLEVFGFLAPGAPVQTEKRAGIGITNYGVVSLAFIDDFLVISPEVAALRAVIDAHENNQTLASNPDFKNSTNWQNSRVLGQLYLSPDLTAKNEPFVQLDDQLQEIVSRFNQKPGPITHAVVNDNAGPFHELHLPKDWVAMFLAGLTADRTSSPIMNNELHTIGVLMSIRSAQTTYKAGKGSYATRDQLVSEGLVPEPVLEMKGYRIEITTTGDKFEVTATPTEYGKTGRQSFYLDESGVIRGADHGGQPGSVADKPL